MALLHSCLVARVRRPAEGEPAHVTLAESNNLSGEGTASAPVIAAYHELLSSKPEAVEARRTYSAVVLIVDNGMRANHEFPDLDAAEAKKDHVAAVRAAEEEKRSAEKKADALRKQLAEVETKQANAAATLANLTGAPVDPVPVVEEESDESDKPEAPKPADPAKPAEGEADPVEKMAARIEAEGAVTAEDLGTLTVAQLKTLATRYELAIPGDATKAQIIEIFLAPES